MRLFILLFLVLFSFNWAFAINSPNVSGNALFLYRNSNFHKEDFNSANIDQERNGFNIREAELQFYSDVDPYTRLNLLLSVHPEYEANGTSVEETWKLEPEEAYVESETIPSVTLRLGKFKAGIGKHNLLHTHAFPFVDAPLANKFLLGDEGFNDVGLSAGYLVPSSWFNEVTIQYFRGEGENAEFNSPSPGDGVGIVHWKNLIDISDELTAEFGASYGSGGNTYRKTTTLGGADLTFKWRPVEGGKYKSVVWSTEYLARKQEQADMADESGSGLATWLRYQFAERWAALYRYDNLKVENTFDPVALPEDSVSRHSAGIEFFPSEFSSFKLEFDQRRGGLKNADGVDTENAVFIQGNFTIGAHPAHSY
jgi:hypothetical protein